MSLPLQLKLFRTKGSESCSYECLCIKIPLTLELLWTGMISLTLLSPLFSDVIFEAAYSEVSVYKFWSVYDTTPLRNHNGVVLFLSTPGISVAASLKDLFSEFC